MKPRSDPSPTLIKLGVVSAAVLSVVSCGCVGCGEGGRASGKSGVLEEEAGTSSSSSTSSHKLLLSPYSRREAPIRRGKTPLATRDNTPGHPQGHHSTNPYSVCLWVILETQLLTPTFTQPPCPSSTPDPSPTSPEYRYPKSFQLLPSPPPPSLPPWATSSGTHPPTTPSLPHLILHSGAGILGHIPRYLTCPGVQSSCCRPKLWLLYWLLLRYDIMAM